MKNYVIYFIALISGGLGVFAFSPFDLWGVAYLSLIGLLFVAKTERKKTALFGAFLWGMSFFTFGVNWLHVSIHQFGGAPLLISYLLVALLAAYLSLYPLLFAYLVQRFQVRGAAVFPVIWTLTEFLRGWLFTGFPWLQFGYTQIDSPFAGLAPLFGVEGLSFFVMWVSAVLFSIVSALLNAPKKLNIALAHTVLLLVIGGLSALSSNLDYVRKVEDKALNISLVQGNIEQNLKWDPAYAYQTFEIYSKLINQQLGKTDLIILPEAALPVWENEIRPFFDTLQQAAQRAGSELLIGTVYEDETRGKLLNSIINIGNPTLPYRPDTANRYSKHHLVPFGEYVPLEHLLRPLGTVFNLPMSAFQQGDKIQPPLLAKNRRFTPAICYEIIFGAQLQQNLTAESDFILTISNDAWFGDSIGPWQHLQMARMRALETGKPVIRATNTGITVFIDEKGKIVAQAPQFTETVLTHRIAPTEGKTPYAVLGTMPLYLLSAVLILLRGAGVVLKRRLVKSAV
ncbi:apolipoprotein N-acyltransferase [Necropsobacter massiliensis]|uniref:apolipoprotein N-acyltransferase n=1 Tax=Necropsobacter massiliensis TaxID=1400001 RepID=UPI000595EF3B|nr:apolipoprotein N-acyltransferase [Necropsobacter massiliensis]